MGNSSRVSLCVKRISVPEHAWIYKSWSYVKHLPICRYIVGCFLHPLKTTRQHGESSRPNGSIHCICALRPAIISPPAAPVACRTQVCNSVLSHGALLLVLKGNVYLCPVQHYVLLSQSSPARLLRINQNIAVLLWA